MYHIVTFMTPGSGVPLLRRGHISLKIKIHFAYKNHLLYSQAEIKQTKYIIMMTKEG